MAVIDRYTQGNFCWSELATSDPIAAKAFYGALFGWTAIDVPLNDRGELYTMLQIDGLDAAALYPQPPDQRTLGTPPHWLTYISVDDVEAMTREAARLGGNVLSPAFPVFDSGKMSIIQDPTGATVGLWQPQRHIGSRWAFGPGGRSWMELNTPDADRAGKYFTRLFGWKLNAQEMGDYTYYSFQQDGNLVAGMVQIQRHWGRVPPHWVLYFGVGDVDAAAQRALELGGRFESGVMDFPGGRLAHLFDPQGARFAIIRFDTP